MNHQNNDLVRARALGMTLEEFQGLVGYDPLDSHTDFLTGGYIGPKDSKKDKKSKKEKEKEERLDASGKDNMSEIPGEYVTYTTDQDVRNKTAREIEHYWGRPVTSEEDKALYYGFHVHSKDNVYGLHAHYPNGPLGGGHKHDPQNSLGTHTHRYSEEELLQFKFARPGIMIERDGPHTHECNAPDGKHVHAEENFGPASDKRAAELNTRNALVDKNVIKMHPDYDSGDIYDDQ